MKNNKKLMIVLAVSLGVNILFTGIFLGKESSKHRRHEYSREFNMKHYNKKECRGYRNKMDNKHKFSSQEDREAMHNAKKDLEKALLTEPYNKQAVLNAFEKVSEQMEKGRIQMHEKIANKAENLSPSERLELLPKHPCNKYNSQHKNMR